ncbi:MAG: hypothetical protein SFU56_00730 [Capsulimonadales bacterium]|nr:hypothetical protein [Capsulimonadales bacterium]
MLFTSKQITPQNPVSTGSMSQNPARVSGPKNTSEINLLPLQAILFHLTRNCAESLGKCVRHFEGEDAWGIGAMPNCMTPADNLEAEARALLCNSMLSPDQTMDVTVCLKVAADLRTVARCARQASQLSWLFRQMPNDWEALEIVLPVGRAAYQVAIRAAECVEKNDPILARDAALLYRRVDLACAEAERILDCGLGAGTLTPECCRMVRAAVWFMAIAGEAMARIAARVAL